MNAPWKDEDGFIHLANGDVVLPIEYMPAPGYDCARRVQARPERKPEWKMKRSDQIGRKKHKKRNG